VDFSTTVKVLVFKTALVPMLTYGHESWVMTEGVISQVQAAEMGFLRRVHGVTLGNTVRSCEIRETLNVEPLLPTERSQLP